MTNKGFDVHIEDNLFLIHMKSDDPAGVIVWCIATNKEVAEREVESGRARGFPLEIMEVDWIQS